MKKIRCIIDFSFITDSSSKTCKLLNGNSMRKVNKLTHKCNINSHYPCSSLWIYLITSLQKNLRINYSRQNIIETTKQNQSIANPSSAFEFPFLCNKGISNTIILLNICEGCKHKTMQLYSSNYSTATSVTWQPSPVL